MALQGTIETFSLSDVLGLLIDTHKTGVLGSWERGSGEVYVADGGGGGGGGGRAPPPPNRLLSIGGLLMKFLSSVQAGTRAASNFRCLSFSPAGLRSHPVAPQAGDGANQAPRALVALVDQGSRP